MRRRSRRRSGSKSKPRDARSARPTDPLPRPPPAAPGLPGGFTSPEAAPMPMIRRLAPLLLLLFAPAHAHATAVTGYAMGHVTANYYVRDVPANTHDFVIGELIFLSFTYDLAPVPALPPGPYQ